MPKKRAPFRGALFDMDGLLLDSERACVVAFDNTVKAFGLAANARGGAGLHWVA